MSKSKSAARRVTPVAVVLVSVLLALSGCGKKDGGGGSVVADAGPRCAKAATLTKSKGKPTKVAMPKSPVTELQTEDLKVGTGAVAVAGKQLTVNYVGIECNGGVSFDSSWGRKGTNKDDPLKFVLGKGTVIKGWDKGIAGMKEGGLRRLVIPGDLAYGATGKDAITADDTLVFVVQLIKVEKAPPATTTTTATTAAPTTTAPKSGSSTSTSSTTAPLTTAVPKTTKP